MELIKRVTNVAFVLNVQMVNGCKLWNLPHRIAEVILVQLLEAGFRS